MNRCIWTNEVIYMDIPVSFISIIILFDEAFIYDSIAIFWRYIGRNAEPVCVEFCNLV
jgi:hypothetical protein